MRARISVLFLLTTFSSYSQKLSCSMLMKHTDSAVFTINKQENILLRQCDSISDFYGRKEYKCWNFYFRDTSKKDVCKVSISFNGCPEEFCFYYVNNKVIKAEEKTIINCKPRPKWSIY